MKKSKRSKARGWNSRSFYFCETGELYVQLSPEENTNLLHKNVVISTTRFNIVGFVSSVTGCGIKLINYRFEEKIEDVVKIG